MDDLDKITSYYYETFGESKTIWVIKDKELGAELKKLREISGATQTQIAVLMGLSAYKVPNIENGFEVISKDTIFAYLKALETYRKAKESFSKK